MRYYAIRIVRPATAAAQGRPAAEAKQLRGYTAQGTAKQVLPNALDVDFDIPVADFATPMGGGYVKIYGVDLDTLNQASDFNLMDIEIYGGMQKGLPLAKPAQAGLLMRGTIQQAFGNWLGTDMWLELIWTAGKTDPQAPTNLTIDWKAGQLMADAIRATLRAAAPDYTVQININPRLVLRQDQPGFYANMLQFAQFIRASSLAIIRDQGYRGVSIFLKDKVFIVQDASTPATPKVIEFNDLVGQITWLSAATVSITTVMRADLQSGDFVKLPPKTATLQTFTTGGSQSQARARDPFSGVFQINNARHTGRFRGAQGTAWVTTFQATLQAPQAATPATPPAAAAAPVVTT